MSFYFKMKISIAVLLRTPVKMFYWCIMTVSSIQYRLMIYIYFRVQSKV